MDLDEQLHQSLQCRGSDLCRRRRLLRVRDQLELRDLVLLHPVQPVDDTIESVREHLDIIRLSTRTVSTHSKPTSSAEARVP